MKFSEIKGERTLDVICELIDPVANIALDDEAADYFRRMELPEGEDAHRFLYNRLRKSYPALLGRHKADFIHIMATIEGVDDDEYLGTLDMKKLMMDLVELLADPVFRGFFTSAQSGRGEKSSVSA